MRSKYGRSVLLFFIVVLSIKPDLSYGQNCPEALKGAKQLILVTSKHMNTNSAFLSRYIWDQKQSQWEQSGKQYEVKLGRSGLGWAWTFSKHKKKGEKVKQEGDKRTPAGFFSFGKSFGFKGKDSSTYIRLKKDDHICVDDLQSEYYNKIVAQSVIKQKVRGENMRAIKLYQHGIEIDFPGNRNKKSGSCIFLHIWKSPKSSTLGCVAMSQPNIVKLQEFIRKEKTVIGILPVSALQTFGHCIPGIK